MQSVSSKQSRKHCVGNASLTFCSLTISNSKSTFSNDYLNDVESTLTD